MLNNDPNSHFFFAFGAPRSQNNGTKEQPRGPEEVTTLKFEGSNDFSFKTAIHTKHPVSLHESYLEKVANPFGVHHDYISCATAAEVAKKVERFVHEVTGINSEIEPTSNLTAMQVEAFRSAANWRYVFGDRTKTPGEERITQPLTSSQIMGTDLRKAGGTSSKSRSKQGLL